MKIKILHISRKHSLSYCKKRGGMFFLERFILIPVYEEILFGRRDQRKRRHFSVRCHIQINPHFHFALLLTAHLCPQTSLIRVNE